MKAMIGQDSKPIKVGMIVIFVIGSFFFPLFLVIFFQDIFFFSRDHIYFQPLLSAYVLFFAGCMLMAGTFLLDLLYNSRRENKNLKHRPWMFFLGIPAVILTCTLGINSYFYFDPKGLHFNEAFTLERTDMEWTDMKEVIKITTRENNTVTLKEHQFIGKDGSHFTVQNDRDFFDYRNKIYAYIEAADVPMRTIFIEPEE
ncbi:hypothetical protein N780_15165 [Pontibacillus chungwhensis BH030062]|uniref:Uncharacterized protein n=1 Tax=Pontibacillus chungwhensis BH030062 TaxID=1385513 RepID=A0A0A2V147_9BACI|nr:hypothetical protein [Pontibacillus chungwhensis]KGP92758.1 hypothetical protein N780_15165 [Pontibacillus chungwhensis BH030062]